MLGRLAKYIALTGAIAVAGLVIVIAGAAYAQGRSDRIGPAIVGATMTFTSPLLSGLWFWWKGRHARRRRAAMLADQAASVRAQQDEERQRDFLRRRFLERQRLLDSVDGHRAALRRNVERAKVRNDYGRIVSDSTHDAIVEFTSSIDLDRGLISLDEAKLLIFEQIGVKAEEERSSGFDPSNIPFDGHSFEKWVADALSLYGWEAEVTSPSMDQGIDVIATRNGKKVGIQCKLYSSAVGNKAIQEAHAGKAYYGLDAVAVVTSSQYTASARSLAAMTGVGLFSHHDIPALYEMLFP
ncbi:MAG: restriction endonuclease [Rhizobiaceae bacterium]|nr:restriction endonuclease [Rhizobiaceae bacterium]